MREVTCSTTRRRECAHRPGGGGSRRPPGRSERQPPYPSSGCPSRSRRPSDPPPQSTGAELPSRSFECCARVRVRIVPRTVCSSSSFEVQCTVHVLVHVNYKYELSWPLQREHVAPAKINLLMTVHFYRQKQYVPVAFTDDGVEVFGNAFDGLGYARRAIRRAHQRARDL